MQVVAGDRPPVTYSLFGDLITRWKAVFLHLLCSRCRWMEFVLSLGRLVADKLAILIPVSGLVQCCLASCHLVWSAWCSAQDMRVEGSM